MKANGVRFIFGAAITLTLTAGSFADDRAWASPYNTKSALIGRQTFVMATRPTTEIKVAQDYSTKRVTSQATAKDGLIHDADTYNTKLAVRGQGVEEVGIAVVK